MTKLWLLLWHFMQQCMPFLQRPFDTSSLHPLFWLKAQQIACPLASLCANPFISLGHIAFALAEVFALFVGRAGGPGVAFGVGVEEAAFSCSFGLPFAMGSKNIVTLGSVLSSFNLASIGRTPRGSGCTESCSSWAIIVKSSLSARIAWLIETLVNPGGGSLVSCPSSCCTQASCSSNFMSVHWSYAKPRRWSAHWNCKSVEVSATSCSVGVANLTICCSKERIMGFSLRLFWTSLSLLVHLLGAIQVMQFVSLTCATRSTKA